MASLSEFDREQAILSELDASGGSRSATCPTGSGVSTVTVRKDLEGLERRGMLRRIRGGALVPPAGRGRPSTSATGSPPTQARRRPPRRRRSSVPATSSPWTPRRPATQLAEELLRVQPLTVITNGLRTSSCCCSSPRPPSSCRRRAAPASESMVGFLSDVLTGRGRVDKGFFGLVGLSLERGLLDLTPEEAHAKALSRRRAGRSTRCSTAARSSASAPTRSRRSTGSPGSSPTPACRRRSNREWTRAGVAWDLVTPEAAEAVRPARWHG